MCDYDKNNCTTCNLNISNNDPPICSCKYNRTGEICELCINGTYMDFSSNKCKFIFFIIYEYICSTYKHINLYLIHIYLIN